MTDEIKREEPRKDANGLVQEKGNEVGYVTTKAPVSSADKSVLKGLKIPPPGKKA